MRSFTVPVEGEKHCEVLVEFDDQKVRTTALKLGEPFTGYSHATSWTDAEIGYEAFGRHPVIFYIHLAKEDITGVDLKQFPA
jgi:hypothetical protein